MVHPWEYKYPSPLTGFENAPPLSTNTNEDGKSLVNPKREGLSDAYENFTLPLRTDRRGGL
jgi:DOPA 4,5-dioxygenase